MSGGRWDYRDLRIADEIRPIMIPGILAALQEALHLVDWAESGDTDRESAEPKVYDIIKKLGDDIFL